jgi:hypothetical protein
MLILSGANDLLRVVTDAAGDIEVHASHVRNNAGAITPERTNTASITTAITTTVVASPGASQQFNVKHLNIRNNHASQAVLVTVFHTDGTNQEDLAECNLLSGEALVLDQTGRWRHYNANGAEYVSESVGASQADMEAGTSTTKVVTPAVLHFHPAAAKAWAKGTPGDIEAAVYNVSSVTDTNAGRMVVNITTAFSSASYCVQATVERSATGLTVTNLKYIAVRNATQAAGSVELEVWDGTASTAVQEDPAAWHMVAFGDI